MAIFTHRKHAKPFYPAPIAVDTDLLKTVENDATTLANIRDTKADSRTGLQKLMNAASLHKGIQKFLQRKPGLHNSGTDISYQPVIADLRAMIKNTKFGSEDRRQEVTAALDSLIDDFSWFNRNGRTPVYIMEGATGVNERKTSLHKKVRALADKLKLNSNSKSGGSKSDQSRVARSSTDGDEDMALKTIAATTLLLNESAVVTVPDAFNLIHTREFLEGLGACVEYVEEGKPQKPGVIYLASLDNEEQMEWVKLQTAEQGRDIMVLGPPSGHAKKLCDKNSDILFMGKWELKADGTPFDFSTNLRGAGTETFVTAAIKNGAKSISSSSMGSAMALNLQELTLNPQPIGPRQIRQWASNTLDQFIGSAPHPLIFSRIKRGGGNPLFHFPLIPEENPGLMYKHLLKKFADNEPDKEYIDEACDKLGEEFDFLRNKSGAEQAREYLREIAGSHRNYHHLCEKIPSADMDEDECRITIKEMSDQHAINAFAAISLGLKSLYDEKTTGAWKNAGDDKGFQWRAEAFRRGYTNFPGKQVPYDPVVVLSPITGIPQNDDEKKLVSDKVMLMQWINLHSSLMSTISG